MPRKPRHHAEKAAKAFTRNTASASPHAAIEAGRSARVLEALFEGQHTRYFSENGRKARRAVQKRHPMAQPQIEGWNADK